MAITPDLQIFAQGHAALEAGTSMKEALEQTGLTYSQLWVFHKLCTVPKAQGLKLEDADGILRAMTPKAEGGEGNSWGMLGVRLTIGSGRWVPEAEARRRYEELSGLSSKGQRPAGKGGRRVVGLEDAYSGDAAKHGVKLLAASQRKVLEGKSHRELQALAKALGLPAKGSKAELMERLAR